MKSKTLTLIVINFLLLTGRSAMADDSKEFRDAGVHSVPGRISTLEALVEKQALQIDALEKALSHEVNIRMSNEVALQFQITNLLQSAFSPVQTDTLKGVADATSVTASNIYIAGNLCLTGDFAVSRGYSLFVSHIQPSDGAWGGDSTGITVFDGNVGIQGTNTLFINNLMPFQIMPRLPGEGTGIGFHGTFLWDGGILFRDW